MIRTTAASLAGGLVVAIFAGAAAVLLSGSGLVSYDGLRFAMFAGFWAGVVLVITARHVRKGMARALTVSGMLCIIMPMIDRVLPASISGPQLDLFGFGQAAIENTLGGAIGVVCGITLLALAFVLSRIPDQETIDNDDNGIMT